MKKTLIIMTAIVLMLSGCGTDGKHDDAAALDDAAPVEESSDPMTFTDALGRKVIVAKSDTVVSLYGSFAEAWTLAGGSLAGITRDALDEGRRISGNDAVVVGTTKDCNIETIISLSPDLVLLSADLESQRKLDEAFTEADITHAYFHVDTWQDYLEQMSIFCRLTGRDDLYEQNAASIEESIRETLDAVPQAEPRPTALLIRAFSTGAKAKGADNLAGVILRDLGVDNIADREQGLLEDLSLEVIVQDDPDYIFVVAMGSDEAAAYEYLQNGLFQNPAWSGLSAVQNNRVVILPRNLFHFKPNDRWSESCAYLWNILYGA